MSETLRPMTVADLSRILDEMPRYWAERDMRAGHHYPLVHEFGPTCFVADSPEGYIHFIATRDDARGTGLGRRLHEEFARLAAARGATSLKAITAVTNTNSVAFHTAIGFAARVVEDYAGPGKSMVVFTRAL
jgi:ribosomal protein S18 acetylase RimI-like enzyme